MAVDLIKKLLAFDPLERLTAGQALAHPWFALTRRIGEEKACRPLVDFDFDFEKFDLTKSVAYDLIKDEICLYYSQEASSYYSRVKQSRPEGILELIFKAVATEEPKADEAMEMEILEAEESVSTEDDSNLLVD